MPFEKERPLGIKVLAIIDFIFCGLLFFVGITSGTISLFSLFLAPVLAVLGVLGWAFSGFITLMGACLLISGLGKWFGWTLYWYVSIILQVLGLFPLFLFSLLLGPFILVSICWQGLILWYFWTRRSWFGVGSEL